MTESCDALLSVDRAVEPFWGLGRQLLASLSVVLPGSELRNAGVDSVGLPHQVKQRAGPWGPGVARREPFHQPGRVV